MCMFIYMIKHVPYVVHGLSYTGALPCTFIGLSPFGGLSGRSLARPSLKAHSMFGPQA